MDQLEALAEQLQKTGREVFWQGKASAESIRHIEAQLKTRLPDSFRDFLVRYGGGGLIGEEISGIEDDDPSLEYRGTVLGDTLRCRADFALPSHLIVIYLGADDVVWCLDTSAMEKSECPVVSYDFYSKSVKQLANSFSQFFAEYVTLIQARG